MLRFILSVSMIIFGLLSDVTLADAWFDETHIAIAKVAGYQKWFNAAAADVVRVKIGKPERYNHYCNIPRTVQVTPDMVLQQAEKYDTYEPRGHLYGAIMGSIRVYQKEKLRGRYAENHMAFLVHYVGDLSMPLHHTLYNAFNKKNHYANDGIINDDVLENLDKIELYAIEINSYVDLAKEVARIANLSKSLGYRLADEDRMMTRDEAFRQIAHSASLLKGILKFVKERL